MLFLNHPLVRAHYLKHGHVFTLRSQRRQGEGVQALVHGSRFRHKPLGRGVVTLVKSLPILGPRQVAAYVRRSGFAAGRDWIAAYLKYNHGRLVLPAHLYKVERIP